MGQAWSTFLVPGLPSCSGQAWPMLVAARTGDHRHLVRYAQQEPLLLLACTVKGYSLAHMAAESGSLTTLQLLVTLVGQYAVRLTARLQEVLSWSESGAEMLKNMRSQTQQEHMGQLLDPNQVLSALLSWQDIKGVTPLMLAARGGHAECVELLLKHGANPLLLDSVNRRSCLHYAAGAGHARCINILLNEFVAVMQTLPANQQQQDSQQQEQQQQQQQRRLVLLPEANLKDGIRGMTSFVDLRTRTGFSALHYATFWGFLGCVQALLTAGATIDLPVLNPSRQHSELPVVNGSTALHLAADYGHTAIATLLLHAHVTRMERNPPAHLASRDDPEWLPWEGVSNHDPRIRRNLSADTPLSLNGNRCNSSSVLKVLLDPFMPISRTLPLVLDAIFGGSPRLGVPKLGVLAKAALDQHLTGTLDQLEQDQQQQQQQQLLLQRQLSEPVAAEDVCNDEFVAGLMECEGAATGPCTCADDSAADSGGTTGIALNQLQQLHDCSSNNSIDALAKRLTSTDMFVRCTAGDAGPSSSSSSGISSAERTPAASRSTSYGSISSLGSSSAGLAHSSSVASSVAGCSPCSTGSIPRVSSGSSIAFCGKCNHSGVCSAHVRGISIDSIIAESVATSLTDRTCTICFDASANVMMAGCCHCVCMACARSLLQRTSVSKPALCPFCRAGLSGFVAAPCT